MCRPVRIRFIREDPTGGTTTPRLQRADDIFAHMTIRAKFTFCSERNNSRGKEMLADRSSFVDSYRGPGLQVGRAVPFDFNDPAILDDRQREARDVLNLYVVFEVVSTSSVRATVTVQIERRKMSVTLNN